MVAPDKVFFNQKSRVDHKTVARQMVIFPNTYPHHEGVMKITTFLSVNNGNLGMSNGTIRAMAPKFALFTKGSKLPLNKGFKNMF